MATHQLESEVMKDLSGKNFGLLIAYIVPGAKRSCVPLLRRKLLADFEAMTLARIKKARALKKKKSSLA
jgi:hypothetical protein